MEDFGVNTSGNTQTFSENQTQRTKRFQQRTQATARERSNTSIHRLKKATSRITSSYNFDISLKQFNFGISTAQNKHNNSRKHVYVQL